ncbi:MAG: hydroxysqualene dehydroxylase HpnE [Actinomycetota bacterium]|nr:hydroxysqualene dehydroxylase HpnE [Actinomycetota bacterium]
MTEPRVVVVGGGLAGLAAALSCADGGARVTLLEARPRLGGATFSFQRDGLWVDNGQHVFLRCCVAYLRFLDRVGARDRTVLQDRMAIPVLSPGRTTQWLRRSALPAPLHLSGSLARYGFLRPAERARAVRAALALARMDPRDPALDNQTFGSWLASRGQSPAAVDALWNLIALPTLNLAADQASLALAVKVFRTGLLERRDAADIGYPRVPLSEVHGEPAARALAEAGAEVRLRAAVRRVEPAGKGLEVETEVDRVEADAVVLAVPHGRAAEILPAGAVRDAAALASLGSAPIVNVHVIYDRPVMDVPFAAGLGTPVQWVFDRTEQSGLDRGQYLAVSISGADREIAEPTADLRERYLPALPELFPRARGARVEKFFVTREPHATFRQAPGSGRLRPSAKTGVPGLSLAGAWTDTGWPATMEGAVRSGFAAAREALVSVGRTRRLPEVVAA